MEKIRRAQRKALQEEEEEAEPVVELDMLKETIMGELQDVVERAADLDKQIASLAAKKERGGTHGVHGTSGHSPKTPSPGPISRKAAASFLDVVEETSPDADETTWAKRASKLLDAVCPAWAEARAGGTEEVERQRPQEQPGSWDRRR